MCIYNDVNSNFIRAFQYDGNFVNHKGEYYVDEWVQDLIFEKQIHYGSNNSQFTQVFIYSQNLGVREELRVNVGDYIYQYLDENMKPKKDLYVLGETEFKEKFKNTL